MRWRNGTSTAEASFQRSDRYAASRSASSIEHLSKTRGSVGPDDELLEHADAVARAAVLDHPRPAERLHVEMDGQPLVHRREVVDVVTGAVLSGVRAVSPFGIEVTEPGHEELILRLERDLDLPAVSP